MIEQRVIEEILQEADMVKIISNDVSLKKSGAGYKGCCPFHADSSPSFYVSPSKGIWKCFGACNEGGDIIKYIMKRDGHTFVDAVKTLAKETHVQIREKEESAVEMQDRLLRESMYFLNKRVMDFYVSQLEGYTQVIKHLEDLYGKEYYQLVGVGYAPEIPDLLYNWAKQHSENIDTLLTLGWLYKRDDGTIWDALQNRIIYAITDVWNRVEGYTARIFSDNPKAVKSRKYVNSPISPIYDKSHSVFGINLAKGAARSKKIFFLVEGAKDCMKMQSVGIEPTVASLGGEWTEDQLRILKRYSNTICFVNDADEVPQNKAWGAGIDFVLKNGVKAVKLGMNVYVKELQPLTGNIKQDPAVFFTSKKKLKELEDQNFIVWYAKKKFSLEDSLHYKRGIMAEVSELISYISDDVEVLYILEEVNKVHRGKSLWKKAVENARAENAPTSKPVREEDDETKSYGFYIKNNSYYGCTGSSNSEWSNFVLTPLFHIKDKDKPLRIFHIINAKGESNMVEFTMDELCSISKFRQKIEGLGDYMWMSTENNFMRVKRQLFASTETAIPVTKMGWNKSGFYAFGDGVLINRDFIKADENGICVLSSGKKLYLPSSSAYYKQFDNIFELEKRFVYKEDTLVPMNEFLKEFVKVFGDNGMFGLCFLFASLFHDIVRDCTRKFPILNLCGKRGSGKTEMGMALMSFFGKTKEPPDLRNASAPALSKDLDLLSNCLFMADEYKNTIKLELIEFLKGLYDCVGRKKMAGKNFEKSIMTSVCCGLILAGQEMPVADIALFHRCIFLTFPRSDYNQEELNRFSDFYELYKDGVAGYAIQILKEREYFENHYAESYSKVMKDIRHRTENQLFEARIIENWARIVAAALTLSDKFEMPYTYEQLIESACEHIQRQNKQCNSNDDIARFWKNFRYLLAQGEIFERSDFVIRTVASFKPVRGTTRIFKNPKKLLYLNPDRVFKLAYKVAIQSGERPIDSESLELYIDNSPEFLGKKASVRFDKIINGITQYIVDGKGKQIRDQSVLQAYAFDYEQLSVKYGLQLTLADAEEKDKEKTLFELAGS